MVYTRAFTESTKSAFYGTIDNSPQMALSREPADFKLYLIFDMNIPKLFLRSFYLQTVILELSDRISVLLFNQQMSGY